MAKARMVCGKCYRSLADDFKFCPFCGTSAEEKIPYFKAPLVASKNTYEPTELIYGVPNKIVYHCKNCNNDLVDSRMRGPEIFYCPVCGNKYKSEDITDDR